jgi:PAS domain S-box-containing protein
MSTGGGSPLRDTETVLAGGGEMGALMRATDWSKTPLGPVSRWPQSLRTTVSTCLSSRFPILVWWGPEMVKLYNDAYRFILGGKHPVALGAKGRDVWPEIWNIIGPMLEGVLQRGEATWSEDILLPLERKGFLEECYFTFSYSPIRDESGGVGGIFTAVTETTERVLGDRRLRTLRELASATLETRTSDAVCAAAVATLSRNPDDLPFFALYLRDGERTRCTGVTGLARSNPGDDAWHVDAAARTGRPIALEDLEELAKSGATIHKAITLPVMRPGEQRAAAVLVAGLSPLLALDEAYAGFLDLVAGQIAAALSAARAHEAERKRAEALAELDRAKTAFFSNVSHEFRTPLTLILGPVEDALRSPSGSLSGEPLRALYRNSLRLLNLVNALLDFSRIEEGGAIAVYQPTDAQRLTAELAGAFRSAVERASLRFEIDCPDLPEPLWIDHDLWEKLVLNLLSNALKFTFEGSIRLGLRWVGRGAELTVADTGTGIAEEELPRIFERFHRVAGVRARTHEGSGIGLALVQEIARLHGGTVRVESRPGQGATFRVFVPRGNEHLPREQVRAGELGASSATGAAPFLEEALRWLPADGEGAGTEREAVQASGERVLVADDNPDMREYVARLLSQRWQVRAVADGAAALALARSERPDLLLADAMMPGLDGFELLRALRADAATRDIPVIMLSARAGEEARIEGIEAGADDYLVKPFSARELIARVSAHLTIGRLRAEAGRERERLAELFQQVPVGVAVLEGPEHRHTVANPSYCAMLGRGEVVGRTLRELFPDSGDSQLFEVMERVYRTGEPVRSAEMHARIQREGGSGLEDAWFSFVTHPLRGAGGNVTGVMLVAADVTEQVRARRRVEDLRAAAESANAAKDDFLAMLGHELRNPLAPIATALHLMKLRSRGALEKERAVIERQTAHLTRLVDDLLDVSRITRGKVELRRRRLEASEAVARAIEMVSPLLEERQHRLTIAVPSRGLAVDADPARLSQVVANLLTNAAKYTDPGGSIEVSAGRSEGGVRMSVRDNGVGIDPAMVQSIFNEFVQERQALDRSRGGLGLGLAIVRSLVLAHGGRVFAESAGRGQGAAFHVWLPGAEEASAGVGQATAAPATPSRDGRRVLVVDDNADAAGTLADVLATMGHRTMVAADGPSALQAAAAFDPEIALLDVGLPVMDGYELARRLRAGRPELQAVALTGYGQEQDRRRAREAGFAAHLVKPISIEMLVSVIASLPRSAPGAKP